MRERARPRRGGHPGDVDDVLDADGDAVQEADRPAGAEVLVAGARLRQRGTGSDERPGANLPVGPGDAIQAGFDDMDRGQLSAGIRLEQADHVVSGEIGHGRIVPDRRARDRAMSGISLSRRNTSPFAAKSFILPRYGNERTYLRSLAPRRAGGGDAPGLGRDAPALGVGRPAPDGAV